MSLGVIFLVRICLLNSPPSFWEWSGDTGEPSSRRCGTRGVLRDAS
jgi:hypothetical protein